MKAQILSLFPMPYLSVIALIIFFGFFVSLLFWVFRRGGNEFYEMSSNIPFSENEVGHEPSKQ